MPVSLTKRLFRFRNGGKVRNKLTALAKPPCQQNLLQYLIWELCFLALAIAVKKSKNCQWNLCKVVANWHHRWISGFSILLCFTQSKWTSLLPVQRILTNSVRESITVRLTSCLTRLDLTKQVNLLLIQHKKSSWIQAYKTGGHQKQSYFPLQSKLVFTGLGMCQSTNFIEADYVYL